MRKFSKKILLFYLLGTALVGGYLYLIWSEFQSSLSGISSIFGYLDYQNNWRALEDFTHFKVPFKDYYFEYGWFFLAIQSIGYVIFGHTFLSLLISRYLYSPLIGLILSFIIGKIILRKNHLIIIFLFLSLLFRTNYDSSSLRHLMAELSLSFIILFFLEKKPKHVLIAGTIAGLATLTALEYGLALNTAIILVLIVSLFSKSDFKKYFFNRFFAGQALVLIPYFLWLFVNGAAVNYLEFTSGFINGFYYYSPCGTHFPRLAEFKAAVPNLESLVSNFPAEILRRMNFYFVFLFFIIVLLVSLKSILKKERSSNKNLIRLSLAAYGLLIYVRTLDNPCITYFVYGLVPFFLLLTQLIENIINRIRNEEKFKKKLLWYTSIALLLVWFVLTENTGYVWRLFSREQKEAEKKETVIQEFYQPLGWFIDKELATEYKEVVNFINKNTEKHDYIYVYPWGPYNNLTGRKPPNTITNAFQFLAGQKFVEKTKQELMVKKPKVVVINLHNNLGKVHYGRTREDTIRFLSVGFEEGPVFAGEGNFVERYILENYKTVFHNKIAIVMKPRQKKIKLEENKRIIYSAENWQKENVKLNGMIEGNKAGEYTIKEKNASWSLNLKKHLEAEDVAVEFKLDGDLWTKHLSRFLLNFFVTVSGENKPRMISDIAAKDWQTLKLPLSKPEIITTIKLEVGENGGLIWWLNPSHLTIKRVVIYGNKR